jgi:hypothetical protein
LTRKKEKWLNPGRQRQKIIEWLSSSRFSTRERESERETAPPHFLTFTAAGMAAGALLRVQFTPGTVPMANLRP